MWVGISDLPPGHASLPHHHDMQTTIVHVVSGVMVFKVGADGSEVFQAGPGEFAVIPGGLVHSEENPSDEVCRCFVVRNDEHPVVHNLAPVGGD
jgi:uncharacterized RmlC-like cupin family protein